MRAATIGLMFVLGCGSGAATFHSSSIEELRAESRDAQQQREADEEREIADRARTREQEASRRRTPAEVVAPKPFDSPPRATAVRMEEPETDGSTTQSQAEPTTTAQREADVAEEARRHVEEENTARERAIHEAEEAEAALVALARRHGFKEVLADASLADAIESVVLEAVPIPRLRKIAIKVGERDSYLVAQVIPGGALFRDPEGDGEVDVRIIVKSRHAMYDGTPFTALGFEWVKVTGVQSYRTAIGGTAQAFIVERAW